MTISITISRNLFVGLLLMALILGAVTFAFAHSDGVQDEIIHTCYSNNNGTLKIVAADAECKNNETALDWNGQGLQGPVGPPGVDGMDGVDGADGADGLNCWDLNGNGEPDSPDEDTNGDQTIDVNDCKGPPGESGNTRLDHFDVYGVSDETCNDIADELNNITGDTGGPFGTGTGGFMVPDDGRWLFISTDGDCTPPVNIVRGVSLIPVDENGSIPSGFFVRQGSLLP